jgi:2-methylisocitrate lyase-like PEP mutase family enzyme
MAMKNLELPTESTTPTTAASDRRATLSARRPEDVAESVARCVATGVAGLSVEDATGDPAAPLYELPVAVERIRAARRAIDAAGGDVLLTARDATTSTAR